MKSAFRRLSLAAALASAFVPLAVLADSTPQTLPFSQDWSGAGLFTTANNWTGVPGIEGFRGDDITTSTAADPQTLLADNTPGVPNITLGVSNPNTNTSGGLIQATLANPVVAMQGSGTADAPYLLIHLDTSGASNIAVAYNLRDVDGSADNAVQPVALHYRVGNSGPFTNVPAAFVADASSGPTLATLVTPVSVTLPAAANNQPLVQLRIMTANAAGNDEWIGVDDISVTGGTLPQGLSIGDASMLEGDSGVTQMQFPITLTSPAPAGGISFELNTSNGTATGGSDFNGVSGEYSIPEGATGSTINIGIIGDTVVEPDETFTVTISNVTGTTLVDGVATGTIVNDDVAVVAIHEIQGDGNLSPRTGDSVVTEGIVTAIRFNGFNIQTPDAEADADSDTSEGVFVFTNTSSPLLASLQRGDRVRLTATVLEYRPTARPHQLTLTELSGPTAVTVLSSGNALPAPVEITQAMMSTGMVDQLERLEGMRVRVASLTSISPSEGSITAATQTATTFGDFFATVDPPSGGAYTPRPFREPGLGVMDTTPSRPANVPLFDHNTERLRILSTQAGDSDIIVDTGASVADVTGVLDYDYGIYSLMPDPGSHTISGGKLPTYVSARVAGDATIAGFNLLNFSNSGSVTPAAFARRLEKTSNAICNHLATPDIVGVAEVNSLGALQALAAAINDDTYGTCARNPEYVAYLIPQSGSDIHVGYLVSTAEVAPGLPRVDVDGTPTRIGAGLQFTSPTGTSATLFDRPSLVLEATINAADGSAFPVTVIANHLQSLIGVDELTPRTDGWVTQGGRQRAKRGEQARVVAQAVHDMQVADPNRHIVLLGDFNAFEFNDGFVDVMGILTGNEAPADQVFRYVDSAITTPLTIMTSTVPAAERYSYSFDGNAQVLDHMVVNQALLDAVPDARIENPRINADFALDYTNDASVAMRVSDHDPVLLVLPLGLAEADLGVQLSAIEPRVAAGGSAGWRLVLSNGGPTAAANVLVRLRADAVLANASVVAPAGFSCAPVSVGAGATGIDCAGTSMAAGNGDFFVHGDTDGALAGQTVALRAEVESTTADPFARNQAAEAYVAVTGAGAGTEADLSMTVVGSPDGVVTGTSTQVRFQLANNGPGAAASPQVSITVASSGITQDITAPAGWNCVASGPSTARVYDCAFSGSFANRRADVFAIQLEIDGGTTSATLTATSSSTTPDPVARSGSAQVVVDFANEL